MWAAGSPAGAPVAVELTVAASAASLSTVGAVAAELAMRADMTLDDIADLRLAVSEACATLIALADADEPLRCSFRVTQQHLELTAHVTTNQSMVSTGDEFAQHVLGTLTDLVEWSVTPATAHADSKHLRVRLRTNL